MKQDILKKIYYRLTRKLRDLQWKAFHDNKKTITLKLPIPLSIKLIAWGDIARIIYCDQPLLKKGPFFERSTLNKFAAHIKKNSTVLDIGANVGLFTIIASKLQQDTGKVYSFEPTPETQQILQTNIKNNDCKNVTTVPLALSNENTTVAMIPPLKAVKKGYGDAFNQIRPATDNHESNKVVNAVTLDSFLEENGIEKIDLIKVDIEGAELFLFQGASKMLSSNNKPTIIFECCEAHCNSFNYSSNEIISLLNSYGYIIEKFDIDQYIAIPR